MAINHTMTRRSAMRLFGAGVGTAALDPMGALMPADASGSVPATTTAGRTVSWDKHSFFIGEERLNIWCGEFHHWRLPSPEHWRDLLQKLKAAGFNTVSLYLFWGLHQTSRGGPFDFTGIKDLNALLTMARQEGLYVLVRPGPYINAEVSMGGLPSYLVNTQGSQRSTDPAALAASTAWLSAVNQIISRHQITDGGGTVALYQVENELISDDQARRNFLTALVDSVRGDGITVPLFHNDYNLGGRFSDLSTGIEFYAYDHYPLGFNAGGSRSRIGESEATFRGFAPDTPHFITESQGGAFTPWGASFDATQAYDFTDPGFTRQWGVRNIGNGVTAFNYYMIFGGTNWGWTGSPSSGFTSYDYGAALTEARRTTEKFAVQKEIGYYLLGVPEAAASDPEGAPAVTVVSGSSVQAYQRVAIAPAPAGGLTRRLVGLRLADSNDTTDTRVRVALNPGAGAGTTTWTVTDNSGLNYTGQWATTQDATALNGSYASSSATGDTATLSFSGTALQIITPTGTNHGTAEVLLDGAVHGTFTSYVTSDQNKPAQVVSYEITGLTSGQHTVSVRVTGRAPTGSAGSVVAVDAFRVGAPASGGGGTVRWPVVPQQSDTTLRIHGRDALQLTMGGLLGGTRLGYTTSQVFGAALPRRGGHLQLLVGADGEPGETVLLFDARPRVTGAASTWDDTRGELRLNYTHGSASDIVVTATTGSPLTLRVLSRSAAATVWLLGGPSANGVRPVTLVEGADVGLTVAYAGTGVALTGHQYAAGTLRIDTPDGTTSVSWNGAAATVSGGVATVAAPGPVSQTTITPTWRTAEGAPESAVGFDDSGWAVADRTDGFNWYQTVGANQRVVLDSNRYGFWTGSVWYRGHFTGAAGNTVLLNGNGGTGQPGHGKAPAFMQAWINGEYIGWVVARSDNRSLTIRDGLIKVGGDNVIAVVVHNLGLNLDWSDDGLSKQTRGLWDAGLPATGPASWRINGAAASAWAAQGERSMFNIGGLNGELQGWHNADFDHSQWSSATSLVADEPGIRWYRSEFTLDEPAGQETAYQLTIHSERFDAGRTDGSQVLMWVNGWHTGVYIGDIGPQTRFVIPSGWLKAKGSNSLAVAVCAKSGGQGPQQITVDPIYSATLGTPAAVISQTRRRRPTL